MAKVVLFSLVVFSVYDWLNSVSSQRLQLLGRLSRFFGSFTKLAADSDRYFVRVPLAAEGAREILFCGRDFATVMNWNESFPGQPRDYELVPFGEGFIRPNPKRITLASLFEPGDHDKLRGQLRSMRQANGESVVNDFDTKLRTASGESVEVRLDVVAWEEHGGDGEIVVASIGMLEIDVRTAPPAVKHRLGRPKDLGLGKPQVLEHGADRNKETQAHNAATTIGIEVQQRAVPASNVGGISEATQTPDD